MLGKLIKYDLKANALGFLIMYSASIVFAIITRISVQMMDYSNDFNVISNQNPLQEFLYGDVAMSFVNFVSGVSIFSFTMLFSLVPLLTLLFILIRYYKNLFSSEGYLTNTLPVNSSSLLLSKIITAVLWMACSFFVLLVCLGIVTLGHIDFSEVQHYFESLLRLEPQYYVLFFFMIICALISPLFSIQTSYLCISLGQLFNKYRILAAVLIYVGLQFVINIILGVGGSLMLALAIETLDGLSTVNFLLFGLLVVELLSIIGAYLLCHYLLDRKLNLE